MKAIWKGFIAGIVLIVIGAGIIIATLAVNGWSVKEVNYTMETYKAQNDNNSIELDMGAYSLKTEFYDGDKIEITYPVSSGWRTSIKEKDGKLKFETKTKWYFTLFKINKPPETVIKLPKDKVVDIKIDLGAGTVKLASGVYGNIDLDVSAGTLSTSGITCNKLDCDVSAGTLKIDGINCNNLICDVSAGKLSLNDVTCPDIKADVSAGTVIIGVNGAKNDYTIRASVSAGSCNVSNQTGATDKKLYVSCSAGSVKVNFSD
ncbi:MAG: DUF4097 domain-containing protein [Clostridia bacterium]|nr:DUF4097 domain-containing protein [Clostridia bacterium]